MDCSILWKEKSVSAGFKIKSINTQTKMTKNDFNVWVLLLIYFNNFHYKTLEYHTLNDTKIN